MKKLAVLIRNQKQWDAITEKFNIKWRVSSYSMAANDETIDGKLCVRLYNVENWPGAGYGPKSYYLSEGAEIISFTKAMKLKTDAKKPRKNN